MLTGDQAQEARIRAGMTQQELANLVGKTMRSVGNWERADVVPRNAEPLLRAAIGSFIDQPASDDVGLDGVSDARLLAEIARRFDRGREESGSGGDTAPTKEELADAKERGRLDAQDDVIAEVLDNAPGKRPDFEKSGLSAAYDEGRAGLTDEEKAEARGAAEGANAPNDGGTKAAYGKAARRGRKQATDEPGDGV